jgi:hypothetical protein
VEGEEVFVRIDEDLVAGWGGDRGEVKGVAWEMSLMCCSWGEDRVVTFGPCIS